jgi:4-amino-4-deoxy-L-arabinose transferase-like glycosyltransferase
MPDPTQRSRPLADWLLLAGFCGFLFFFGLGYFGLVGADEPRYAQVAREMLARHDWITPTLGGKPWLEKPVLYYWQAILSYRIFGVSDWAARLPSAADATLMVVAIYLFLRRFRPGFHLDGALITACAAGVIGFARAAGPDMPLASTLTIALLAWYAWHESGKAAYLALFYVFLGLGTLAKGPVAPFLAAAIVVIFAAAVRDWRLVWRTLWIPGILLFCVVALPWYVAVQVRNPEFFRVFILEHNLGRFGSDLYHHTQPIWYYLPVVSLGLVPWIVLVIAALLESVRAWWNNPTPVQSAVPSQVQSENALNLFMAIWLVVPVIFFSISKSKLPGYILPALPAGTLLLAEYVRRHLHDETRPHRLLIVLHSIVAALPVGAALMVQYILLQHQLPWNRATLISGAFVSILAVGMALTLLRRPGLRLIRFVTLVPVVLALGAMLRLGAPALDSTLSARPLAQEISRIESKPLPLAVLRVSRETEYGLQFYRDQPIARYELGQIPAEEHLLVAPQGMQARVAKRTAGRRVSYLGSLASQALDYYWVSVPGMQHEGSR